MSDELQDELIQAEEEIDVVSEQLAAHSIMSEERHEQILEGIDACQTTLSSLSERVAQNPESPMLAQIQTDLSELRNQIRELGNQLVSLKSSLDSRPLTPQTPEPPTPPAEPNSPNQEESTEEPKPEEPEAPKPAPVKRFRKL